MTIKPVDSLVKLSEWMRQLRREHPLGRVIDIVAARTEQVDGDEYRFLILDLAGLLQEAGRNAEAIQVLDGEMSRDPDDVRPALSKAHIYFSALDQPEQALEWIDVALDRARRTGFFRREALGDKARILLKLLRGDELSDVLEEIMSVQITPGIPDIARERDFVDRAPPGLIRKTVLDRYNEFRPPRSGDSLADEPPKYEPANDRT